MKKNRSSNGDTQRSFGLLDSISYAAGDFGCNMSFALKSTLAIFWTQYMGLELWYSLLLVIVQVWDAVNDPLIGSMLDSDTRKYKRNKFLTYIRAGSIGLIFGGALCFIPVPSAPLWAQMIVFVSGYVVWDAFYTVANVPYSSLLSLISAEPSDRASLSAWRSIGSTLGQVLPVAVLPFIIYDDSNNLIGERVFICALVMGVIGFIAFRFMLRTTVIREDIDIRLDDAPRFNIVSAMRNFLKNRPAVGVTVGAMGTLLGMQGNAVAVTVLFQSYFKNIDASGIVQVFSMIPVIAFTPFVRRLVDKHGKQEISVFGATCSVAACILMLVLPITPDPRGMMIYIVCQLINSLGIGIFSTVSWALMGDAIDYNEWKTGRREEGVIFSLHSFFRKLVQGLGPALVLVIMVFLGYVGENEGNQTYAVALNMRYLVAVLYLVSAVIELIGLKFIYNLDRHSLDRMNAELKRKHKM